MWGRLLERARSSLPTGPIPRKPGETHPPAETWLRRAIAAVGCLLLIAVIGGSAVSDDDEKNAGTSAAAGSPTPTASPTPTGPTEPDPVLAGEDDTGEAPAGIGPTANGVAAALAGVLGDPRLGNRVSAMVLNPTTGKVLLNRSATRLATPASTAKLVTAAALLASVPPDTRLRTRVVAGATPGEVVLIGGGDPTLTAATSAAGAAYPGAARVADLAAAVKKALGATPVTKVTVDGSLYSGSASGPGWLTEDVAGGYVAPITAAMVDAGRTNPKADARTSEPDLAAGRALAAALGVPSVPVARGKAAAAARELGVVQSPPVSRLVELTLQLSDNVLAEALSRQVAIAAKQPASFAGGVAASKSAVAGLGVPVTGLRLVDGSGLSTRDKVSPEVLAALLKASMAPANPALHALVPALPVGGYDGTLDDRYLAGTAKSAAGLVRAKTGTLDGVSSLAGLVQTRSGHTLVFAVIADGVPIGGTRGAESALDGIAATLATCGC